MGDGLVVMEGPDGQTAERFVLTDPTTGQTEVYSSINNANPEKIAVYDPQFLPMASRDGDELYNSRGSFHLPIAFLRMIVPGRVLSAGRFQDHISLVFKEKPFIENEIPVTFADYQIRISPSDPTYEILDIYQDGTTRLRRGCDMFFQNCASESDLVVSDVEPFHYASLRRFLKF